MWANQEMDTKYELFLSNNDFNQLKENGQKLLEKYAKPENFDKLAQAQNNVNEIKVEMQENVNKLIKNQDELDTLEGQTRDMKDNAQTFDKNAKSLEREMFWRKVKYTAVIIAIVIAIILIIVLSVVLTKK